MKPAFVKDGFTLYLGDCLSVLRELPDESVNCCVTSPPYFNLRNYGVDGQIGLEQSPDEYVAKMVEVFREVRRVLRSDAVLFLNLGDSYCNTDKWGGGGANTGKHTIEWTHGDSECDHNSVKDECSSFSDMCVRCVKCGASGRIPSWNVRNKRNKIEGIKPKDLIGIPWMVAFALRADGWWLRQDIIFAKTNPMPESVTDRCTKSHEYIFLMSKSSTYYFDNEAIKEPSVDRESFKGRRKRNVSGHGAHDPEGFGRTMAGFADMPEGKTYEKRNKRSVWTVSVSSYQDAHFATFPPELITPCIQAGCPEGGVVLDPFMGSGTTADVSVELGRKAVGIELNPEYVNLMKKRFRQARLMI